MNKIFKRQIIFVKILVLTVGLLISFVTLVQAQQRRYIKSHEYMQWLEIEDTTLATNRTALEQIVQDNYRTIELPSNPVIPVIFHVLYQNEEQQIGEAQLKSQIAALNRDFGFGENTEFSHESLEKENFTEVSNQVGIQFCLPQFSGDSSAINYHLVEQTSWEFNNDMKDPAKAGVLPWNPDQFLNIYVVDLTDSLAVSGFAQMPGGNSLTDGIVVDYNFVGTVGSVSEPYHLGRTLVHLVGNYLGLYSIWGAGDCNSIGDRVIDTPPHNAPNFGCPVYKHVSSCPSDQLQVEMTMNFMDNTDDACLSLFTTGQKYRLFAYLETARNGLLSGNFTCSEEELTESVTGKLKETLNPPILISNQVSVYPNPGSAFIQVSFEAQSPLPVSLQITDLSGREMLAEKLNTQRGKRQFNTQNWNSGIYVLSVFQNGTLIHAEKIAIKH